MSMGSQPPQDRFFRPEPISLREAWPREDQDFTPWLADNLPYLSDIGLEDLELVGKVAKLNKAGGSDFTVGTPVGRA